MDVQVVGNFLVVTPDKHQRGKIVWDVLQEQLRLPQGFLRQLFTEQRIRQGRTPLQPDAIVQAGHKIRLEGGIESSLTDESGIHPLFESGHPVPDLDVLFEDDHLLVVNKPKDLLVYPGGAKDTDTLGHRVAQYYRQQGVSRQVYHVHRLDRDTSGGVLYAKHAYSARALDMLLTGHQIHRAYLALIHGLVRPPNGSITLPIGRDRHVSGRYRVSGSGKDAVTHYRTLAPCKVEQETMSLIECDLETGRTHQIRVHLASRGCPIVGDLLYGGRGGVGPIRFAKGQALHARELAFPHPYEDTMVTVLAPLPEEFQAALFTLGLETFGL